VSDPAILGRDLFLVHASPHGDVSALRGLDLSVAAGERVALLGPSGAGKTSLLRLCAGFDRPSSGRLRVAGVAVESAGARRLATLRRDSLGLVHQHFHRSLPAELSVREIASLPLRLAGGLDRAGRRRVDALLGSAGLADRAGARPEELSGGEQQRVAVCAALAKRPRVVLADEPTGELDRAASSAVVELMFELAGSDGAAVVIVTHDLRVAERADRMVHVRDGRVSAEGAGEQRLVVDDQGWLRLPRELREAAGIGRHVRATLSGHAVRLEPPAAAGGPAAIRARPASVAAAAAADPPGGAGLAVELRGVGKAFGGRSVLDELDHCFAPGRLHVVHGPSGSGKTTLLLLLAALEAPDRGAIVAGGRRIDGLSAGEGAAWRREAVGYLNQHSLLSPLLDARENVALALELRGAAREEAWDAAARWLEWVGLGEAMARPAARLSGGEQRRVAIAQALGGSPRLLVVDEPTAHLDRAAGHRVIALLRRAGRERGSTVVASTHDPDLIEAADDVLAL